MSAVRGRDGDLIPQHLLPDERHHCGAEDKTGYLFGYLGEDAQGRPAWCYTCRPNLRPGARVHHRGFSLIDA